MAGKKESRGHNGRQTFPEGKRETTHAVKPLAFTLSEVGSQQSFEQRITQPTLWTTDCREATLVKAGD